MVPPEVNTAILSVLSAFSRMRCRPVWTRSTKPSQLSSPGGSYWPPPALDDQGEDTLEFGAVLRSVTQDVKGFGLLGQHVRQQGADHCVGIELIERGVNFHFGNRQLGGGHLA